MKQALWEQIQKTIRADQDVLLSGLDGAARIYFLHELINQRRGKLLCMVASEEKAYDLANDLRLLLGENKVNLFLSRDFIFLKENSSLTEVQRVLTLQELLLHPQRQGVIITTPGGMLYHIMSPQEMQERTLILVPGQDVAIEALLKQLVERGYERVDTVTRPGQMAARGGLVDVFPAGDRQPCRIDFFGDTIDVIKH
ncbi:MAG TPA: transcription-repair coupling factor, partial [Syntrophomonas sp.]|nr:transcription-repair coupling factor [Syntrophomonas sp.]